MRNYLSLSLVGLLLITACQTPTTARPAYTKNELRAEQQAQAAAAKQATAAIKEKSAYSGPELEQIGTRLAPIAKRIEQSAGTLCLEMRGARAACQYQVKLDPKGVGLNAHADGQNVVLYPAMVDFATNDTHLAFVIAHEFAHNIMGHIKAQQQNVGIGGILGTVVDVAAQSQGYNTQGTFGKLGANTALLRYSPSFESEADYVGLYILARADYPITEAPNFWRLMSVAHPDAIYTTSTHPNNPARTIEMEKTVREINAKKKAGQPLLPTIKPKA